MPSCPGGVVSDRLQGALHYPGGEGFFSISRGRAEGEELKGNMGLTFPIRRLQQPPPTSRPRGCLPVYLQVGCTCGAAGGACGRAPGGEGRPPPTCCAPGWTRERGRGQSAEVSLPAPTLASERGFATETGVVLSVRRSGSALL